MNHVIVIRELFRLVRKQVEISEFTGACPQTPNHPSKAPTLIRILLKDTSV